MVISKTIEIDLGHSVTNHSSKCANLHGHRYSITANVAGKLITKAGDSSEGMVIDFGDLKKAMMQRLDEPYDHGFVIWVKDPRAQTLQKAFEQKGDLRKFHLLSEVPTAENLALHWFVLLEEDLRRQYSIRLESLEVKETPTSVAIVTHASVEENALVFEEGHFDPPEF